MSFLFEPVSAAIDTLKDIKSGSDKGPDPNRFVTRLPVNPGKWALATAFKRQHNLWKWTQSMPNKVPRRHKAKKKQKPQKLKIVRQHDEEHEDGAAATEKTADQEAPAPTVPEQPDAASGTDRESVSVVSHITRESLRKSNQRDSSDLPLDEDGMPFFAGADDDEAEQEAAKRLAQMSPEQKVYYRSCEHFKVRPSKTVMKQVDSFELNLSHSKLRDLEFKAITTGLVLNLTLKVLDLSDTGLNEKQMTYLTDFLEDDNGITDLILKDNHLEGRVFIRLLESMKSRDVIVYLDISGNNLRDKDLPMFTSYIESSSQLSNLYMGRNKFTSRAGDVLGKVMAGTFLIELSVRNNQLRADGMISFLNGLARNSTIERLDLSWNGIGPEAVRALVSLLRVSPSITCIDLSGTRLNGECLDLLTTQALVKNTVLQRLGLKNNPLLNNDIITFLNKLYANPTTGLKRIDLGDYQVLDASVGPLLDQLFWEKNMDIRYGHLFAYSNHAETVERVAQRFRQDALAAVTSMKREDRLVLVQKLRDIDMEEAMETGADIPVTSFLGRVNENRVSYQDLARRLIREGDNPREAIKRLLGKDEVEQENAAKGFIPRFTLTPQEARRLQLAADR